MLTSSFSRLWAQVPTAAPGPAPTLPTDAAGLAELALRRWCGGLTLSSPELSPRPVGLGLLLIGLSALLLLVLIAQGPRRALRQFFDLSGHLRLISLAFLRVRQAARLVPALLGATVIVWSSWQFFHFHNSERLDELVLLRKTRTVSELAFDQGSLAALTPWRDVAALGDNVLLLLTAAAITFKRSADRWGDSRRAVGSDRPLPAWSTVCWAFAWLYVLYRLGSMLAGTNGLPPGGCIIFEALLVPLMMLLADGLLVGWVVVELRSAGPTLSGEPGLDVHGILELLPGSVLVCLTALPGRYAAVSTWLLVGHVPSFVVQSGLGVFLNGWGVVIVQGVALLFFGLVGGLAWSRGSWRAALNGYGRLLRAEGGRVAALALGTCLVCGCVSALSYVVLLSLPVSAWLLNAADAYAHYATLPLALVAIAALIELGERSLPLATLAGGTKPAP